MEYKAELLARRVRRLTFVAGHYSGTYPGYYTFRGPSFEEDTSIRHSEPALAFQLELGRLSEFKIKPVFTENKSIHVFEAHGKGSTSDNVFDKRYFIREMVRPGRLRDQAPTAEYFIPKAHRLMSDILDALEVIGNNHSDLNHIFLNFIPVFTLQPSDVEEALSDFVKGFSRRILRLRVLGHPEAAESNVRFRRPLEEAFFKLVHSRRGVHRSGGFTEASAKIELFACSAYIGKVVDGT